MLFCSHIEFMLPLCPSVSRGKCQSSTPLPLGTGVTQTMTWPPLSLSEQTLMFVFSRTRQDLSRSSDISLKRQRIFSHDEEILIIRRLEESIGNQINQPWLLFEIFHEHFLQKSSTHVYQSQERGIFLDAEGPKIIGEKMNRTPPRKEGDRRIAVVGRMNSHRG